MATEKKTTKKTTKKTVKKTTAKKTTKKAVKKTVKKAVKKTVKKTVKKAAKKTTAKTTKKTAKKTVKKTAPIEAPLFDTAVEPQEAAVQEVQQEVVAAVAEPVQEVAVAVAEPAEDTPSQEPQVEPAQQASKVEETKEVPTDKKEAREDKPQKHRRGYQKNNRQQRRGPKREDSGDEGDMAAGFDEVMHARYEEIKRGALLITQLQDMEEDELRQRCKDDGLEGYEKLNKQDLIIKVMRGVVKNNGLHFGEGVLEILPDGFGFLRSSEHNYQPSTDDIYVSPSQIRRFNLQPGNIICGQIRPPKENEKYFALLRVEAINYQDPEKHQRRTPFEQLTPAHPDRRIFLETAGDEINMRVANLITPVGFGQRMLIVAPPRTGKTIMLEKIANAINENHPDVYVIVLLIDERPEEVTNMRRNTNAEVVSSTFDEGSMRHIQITEMIYAKAKQMVEYGKDVVILMDSITRMARAFNAMAPRSGKILTGGVDASALVFPRKFFGSARAVEEGGSLTIIATALIETGSRMDEVIFEEFKGTGNSEMYLDRRLVDRRIWPAIDISRSGTRREDLLLDENEYKLTTNLRKVLSNMRPVEAMEMLVKRMKETASNAEFLMRMKVD